MSGRNKKILRDLVELVNDHDQRIERLEKIEMHNSKEIEKLKMEKRDLEISNKILNGVKYDDLVQEYKISKGRISQIKNKFN